MLFWSHLLSKVRISGYEYGRQHRIPDGSGRGGTDYF